MNNLIGKQFDRLTVLAYLGKRLREGRIRYVMKCRCSCGEIHVATADSLRTGDCRSCGCLRRELARQRAAVGRAAYAKQAREQDAIRRQYEPRHPSGVLNPSGYPDNRPVDADAVRQCRHCGESFLQWGLGAPRKYCSETCVRIVVRDRKKKQVMQ